MEAHARRVAYRTRGHSHGPITRLVSPSDVGELRELAVFEESNGALEFEALEDTGFILGSAVKHPHDLVLGTYSVHTHKHALEKGEAKIEEIGKRLQAEGRL